MTVKEVTDLVIYIAAILTAVGAIIFFIQKFLITPMKKILKEEITDMVREIHDQVTPNGGGSLKDDVTLMRQETTDLRQKLDVHMMDEAPRIRAQLDQLQGMFDLHMMEHHHRDGGG